MRELTVILTAGETQHIALNGRFVRVMDASGEFTLQVPGLSEVTLNKGVAIEAPLGLHMPSADLISANSQTVTLIVSDLLIHDDRLVLTDGAVVTVDQGAPNATVFVGPVLTGYSDPIFQPSVNTHGAVIHQVTWESVVTGQYYYVVADTTDPTFAPWSTGYTLSGRDGYTNSEICARPLPMKIPPGLGVYAGSSVSGALIQCQVDYELL